MFSQTTGSYGATGIRRGFTECDDFGHGFVARAFGSLDAPDYIPNGSVRIHNTLVRNPVLSQAHRDIENRPIGACHDGPEAVPPTISPDQRSK